MKTVHRMLVSLFALVFAAIGLELWIAPEQAAHALGIEAIRAAGLATVRADLGGLFVGLALLVGVGVWARRRAALLAAAAVLTAVVIGRAIDAIVGGEPGWVELAVEVVAIVALVHASRRTETAGETNRPRAKQLFWVAATVVAVVAGGAALALRTPGIVQALFDRAAAELTASPNVAPLADDALRVAICGSSAPLPSAKRAKACVAVFAGGKYWIVDSGPESTENLVLWGIPLSEIGGVLLTHFHSDHIGDLGELHLQTWAGGRQEPLPVYGGPGIEKVVDGFNLAYQLDQGYRTDHHGEEVMPSKSWGMVARTITLDGEPTAALDRRGVVYDDGALRITALEVDHAPIAPAYAYRFDYRGRSAVVTGDMKYHAPLIAGAADADLLVSEAISRNMTHSLEEAAEGADRDKTAAIMHDVQDYHVSPEEAAGIANEARVKLLVFYHLLPAPDGLLPRRLFAQGLNRVRRGDWTIADDGSLYTLPLASREVAIGRID